MKDKWEIIFRWIRMLSGKSVFHMRQAAGYYYSKNEVKGYYSDLRHKVTGDILLDDNGVPINITNKGDKVYFSITIFQYGLGAYDLYLETKDINYLNKFFKSVSWALNEQEESGAWNTFGWCNPNAKYSSMAQGEGVSLLVRAFLETKDKIYLDAAKKAIDFMLLSINNGGTTIYYPDGGLTFEETKENRSILNGMIFSIWGLRDYCIISKDKKYYKILQSAVNYLCKILTMYDCNYWSKYDLDGNIASPFYHDLHIEQLKVMYDLFGNIEFIYYAEKWNKYKMSFIKSKRAFLIKAYQKIKKIDNEIVLVR